MRWLSRDNGTLFPGFHLNRPILIDAHTLHAQPSTFRGLHSAANLGLRESDSCHILAASHSGIRPIYSPMFSVVE